MSEAAARQDVVGGLVSTVIPVFNRPARLREAVDSVLGQTYPAIEVIVIDDGSDDATPEVARALAEAHPERVRLLIQPNAGPGAARGRGVQAARGEFVQFLDSDDVYLPGKTARLVEALRADPGAQVAYCRSVRRRVDGSLEPDREHRSHECHRQLFPALLGGRLWDTNSVLYRREVLAAAGPWPALRQCEDWLFDAQVAATGAPLVQVDEVLVELRTHDGGHLGHAWRVDARRHRERCEALLGVLTLAQRAGVANGTLELERFGRTLFFEARMAAAAGLEAEARRLLDAARRVVSQRRWQLDGFAGLAAVVGWQRAAAWLNSIR